MIPSTPRRPASRAAAVRFFGAPLVALSLLLALVLSLPGPALARAQLDLPWSLQQAFGPSLRFVRVDRGCKVVDKDEAAAYIAFECEEVDPRGPKDAKDAKDAKKKSGALELIPMTVQGRPGVRAQVTLADETHGTELRFLDLLERKIRDEKGPPPPPASTKPPPPPPPDAAIPGSF